MRAASVVAGFGLFLISGPFAAIGGNWREAWEIFVESPYEDLVYEPLGRF
jgi:hypothetical protein